MRCYDFLRTLRFMRRWRVLTIAALLCSIAYCCAAPLCNKEYGSVQDLRAVACTRIPRDEHMCHGAPCVPCYHAHVFCLLQYCPSCVRILLRCIIIVFCFSGYRSHLGSNTLGATHITLDGHWPSKQQSDGHRPINPTALGQSIGRP